MLLHVDWTPPDRFVFLQELPKGGVIAEVGVHLGKYARWILDFVKPDLLYLVDVWPDKVIRNGEDRINGLQAMEEVKKEFAPEIEAGIVKVIRCDSRNLHNHIEPGALDWLYLDTDHWYPTTVDELRSLSPLVKPDGFIFGHDYNYVTQQGYCSVERAVNEFMLETDYRLVMLTLESKIWSFGIASSRSVCDNVSRNVSQMVK